LLSQLVHTLDGSNHTLDCQKGSQVLEEMELHSISGVGNYFRTRAVLHLYFWLAGRISVKEAHFKLKKLPFAGWMWPAGRILLPAALFDTS
jgi:hypothetical protein